MVSRAPHGSLPGLAQIAEQFALGGAVIRAARHAGGHINDSHRIETAAGDGPASCFLLQRLNPAIFPDADAVMHNIALVTRHVRARLERDGCPACARRCLTLVPTHSGATHWRDADGAAWRVFRFIENAHARGAPRSAADAHTAGRAFGEFLRLLSDLPVERLRTPIPDFHNTPLRCGALDAAIARDRAGRVAQAAAEIALYRAHRALADALPLHNPRGMPWRAVHNDAKLSNVLLDDLTGDALCVVDLDLVMPGLALFDFGDMVRSMTTTAAEDEADPARVQVRWDFYDALQAGFLDASGDLLSPFERAALLTAGRVITFEQGVRFLGDYLDGDRYYRTERPHQNLDRARSQFTLVERLAQR